MNDTEINRLESLSNHFAERQARAKERLDQLQGGWWCFGVIGLRTEFEEHRLSNVLVLRRVKEPPGEIELAGAMKAKSKFSAVARHSHLIAHEIAVSNQFGKDDNSAFSLAWWFASAIRVRTGASILVPAVADTPWDTVAGASDASVHIQLIEDFPSAFRFESDIIIKMADVQWVSSNLNNFVTLLENPAFRLAVEAATTHHHHANLRMATAAVWAGLEAIFQVTSELRFRIAALLASYLMPPGQERINLYRDVKKLYDFRSRAVHGSQMKNEDLQQHINRTRDLLRNVLCALIEGGSMLSVDDFEARLLGA